MAQSDDAVSLLQTSLIVNTPTQKTSGSPPVLGAADADAATTASTIAKVPVHQYIQQQRQLRQLQATQSQMQRQQMQQPFMQQLPVQQQVPRQQMQNQQMQQQQPMKPPHMLWQTARQLQEQGRLRGGWRLGTE